MAAPLPESEILHELKPYGVSLSAAALAQLSTYLDLLLHWNRRINLTGLTEPRVIVRRLFGETLYLARVVGLKGWLVDIGSGAGFPGLAVKLVVPDLRVTLIESRRRKCAFLKEVVRSCRFSAVEVVTERFEAWAASVAPGEGADIITTRAVDMTQPLLEAAGRAVRPGGQIAWFATPRVVQEIERRSPFWKSAEVFPLPSNRESSILVVRVQ